jgi:hypothetical protein
MNGNTSTTGGTLYRLQGPTETQLPLLENGPGDHSLTSSLIVGNNNMLPHDNINHTIGDDDSAGVAATAAPVHDGNAASDDDDDDNEQKQVNDFGEKKRRRLVNSIEADGVRVESSNIHILTHTHTHTHTHTRTKKNEKEKRTGIDVNSVSICYPLL